MTSENAGKKIQDLVEARSCDICTEVSDYQWWQLNSRVKSGLSPGFVNNNSNGVGEIQAA